MADDDTIATETGNDLKSDLATLKPSGSPITTKRLFLIGLIAVGVFMFYVIFLKKIQPTATATTQDPSANSSSLPNSDASALGSLQTSIQSLQQQDAAQAALLQQTSVNAAAARTNSSIALNGVNDLLGNGGGPKPGPKPAPGPLPKVAAPVGGTPPVAPLATHQMIIGAPTTVSHLQQTGLAHQ